MTKEEKQYYDKVARLGCILCKTVYGIDGTPAELHHVRRFGAKRENSPVIPLCPYHHRHGNTSIHGLGVKAFEKYHNISCQELVDKVEELLNETFTK